LQGNRALAHRHLESALALNQNTFLKEEINRLLENIQSP
jgi:hypothetical protein